MEPSILFEDENLIILNKPSGWVTNEADTTAHVPVVQRWLKENQNYEISGSDEFRSGVVHRLDKETSGILLIAKTKGAFEDLQGQFKERVVKKTYIALMHGNVKEKEGEIKTELGRLPWRRDRFGVLPGGRESVTRYKVLDHYELSNTKKPHMKSYTLTEFYPETGRTHQIRVHSKYIGHPIVSDEFYAGRKTARDDRRWCSRLFLHAKGIKFNNPKTGKPVVMESDLPEDLQLCLGKLIKL